MKESLVLSNIPPKSACQSTSQKFFVTLAVQKGWPNKNPKESSSMLREAPSWSIV